MSIIRIDCAPRMSEAVIHNNTLYYTSVPENLDKDAEAQTENALAAIDALLARVNIDKSRILDVTLFLVDKDDFDAMNRAWDRWVAKDHAPVRCTVQASLMNPGYRIEIKIIAAM
ncbi:MAG: Putative aminoacrylate peracid reductase RutC [Candidatus Erwinia impunctatus]|nr:Putative aminoacrylate peracid reductase RutC [Culicoides impunctatus]